MANIFTYQMDNDLWIGRNQANEIVAQGREVINYSGFTVFLRVMVEKETKLA